MPQIVAAELNDFATELLRAAGLPEDEARLVAESLVEANLRGHDSHGVVRLPSYVEKIDKREVVSGAEFTVQQDGPSLLMADGNWGFGPVQTRRLTERLIAKARETGLALGTLFRCSHVGRLGQYCELAAEQQLVSLIMVNAHSSRRVAPPGGREARLGTNPIAFGVPCPGGPLVLDFGTSAAAEGKVRVMNLARQLCPPGWLQDCNGQPTNDPAALYSNPPGAILPMGGDQAYKGFGLGLMIEIFAGALSGGMCIREKPTIPLGNGVFMLLVNPGRMGGIEHFLGEVSGLKQFIKDCPRADGVSEILVPGDPERNTLARRTAEGIPIDSGNWSALIQLADRLNVPVPLVAS